MPSLHEQKRMTKKLPPLIFIGEAKGDIEKAWNLFYEWKKSVIKPSRKINQVTE